MKIPVVKWEPIAPFLSDGMLRENTSILFIVTKTVQEWFFYSWYR